MWSMEILTPYLPHLTNVVKGDIATLITAFNLSG